MDFFGTWKPLVALKKAVQIFFRTSPLVFYGRPNIIQVWNDVRVSDDRTLILGWTIPKRKRSKARTDTQLSQYMLRLSSGIWRYQDVVALRDRAPWIWEVLRGFWCCNNKICHITCPKHPPKTILFSKPWQCDCSLFFLVLIWRLC